MSFLEYLKQNKVKIFFLAYNLLWIILDLKTAIDSFIPGYDTCDIVFIIRATSVVSTAINIYMIAVNWLCKYLHHNTIETINKICIVFLSLESVAIIIWGYIVINSDICFSEVINYISIVVYVLFANFVATILVSIVVYYKG